MLEKKKKNRSELKAHAQFQVADFKILTDEQVLHLFGKKMRIIRVKKGLTQGRLSKITGLHRNYISDTERGCRNLSLKSVRTIAQGLGVDIYKLFQWDKD